MSEDALHTVLAVALGPWGEGLAGLFFVFTCLMAYTAVAWACFSRHDVAGTPYFALVTQVTFQVVVSPLVVWYGWSNAGFSYEWLAAPYDADPPTTASTLYLWLIMGIMAKDFVCWTAYRSSETPLLMVHHVACFSVSAYCLYYESVGSGLFVLGTMALEIGSTWSTISSLYPSKWCIYAFVGIMTASNVFAAILIVDHMRHLAMAGDMVFLGVHGIISPALLYLRQDLAGARLDDV